MYHVLIVDDELMIRNGIAKTLPWKQMQVTTVLTAASGAEALDILATQNIHLMLTDINMTEMNGLQLIEKARAQFPQLRIIVLTGYDSFEYAQHCCKLHVQDFLLKPADEVQLQEAIERQLHQIHEVQLQNQQQQRLIRAQGVLEQVKLEKTLQNFFVSQCTAENLIAMLQSCHYDTTKPMQLVLMMPELKLSTSRHEERELLSLSVKNLCINLIDAKEAGITFEDSHGNIGIVLFCDVQQDEVTRRMENLRRMILSEYDLSVKLAIGSIVNNCADLSYSYTEAQNLLQTHASDSLNFILQGQKLERRMRLFQEVFGELKQNMMTNITYFDQVMRAFQAFEDCTESYHLSAPAVRRYCFDLASAIYFCHLSESGKNSDTRLTSLMNSLSSATVADACQFTKTFLTQLLEDKDTETHETIAKAKLYISQHLAEDLSVASIAESLYITPNYFSRLFKKVCGEGCNEYIVRQRIDMAKSLLETTNQKTGKVALLVGYRDTNYFSLAFKKHTGTSPTEYREKVRTNRIG